MRGARPRNIKVVDRDLVLRELNVVTEPTGSRAIEVNRPYLGDAGGENPRTVLVTFWVAVPAKTKPREFFEFLQQQGYLRIWLNGEIVRVDTDAKVERLGARVQVLQDRIAVTEGNRTRLTEAIETALRFGKGKINVIPLSENAQRSRPNAQRPTPNQSAIRDPQSELPFSTGWHCAHCDLDVRPPT